MSTRNDESAPLPSAPQGEPVAESGGETEENVHPDRTPSEIATRLSLLGKLIIPPSAP